MKLINDSVSVDTMETQKTPSFQSLLDSDLESMDGFQCLNFDLEELDDLEYALPSRDVPTLAEALLEDDEGTPQTPKVQEPLSCLALQEEFLQGVSQQLHQAQNRSSTGAATSISIGPNERLTVGTAHGHLLTFQEQVLRWVCNLHTDHGAVSCLAYNPHGDRILAGFARGLICQYDSVKGIVLRRVTLSGETWGILRLAWAGTTGLALDTGGSVWLLKFARPLGVRSAKCSCLFSGARGEVVAMAALDARILALATLSRVIIVAGGQAAGVRLEGPPDTLPVLTWSETEPRTLICARACLLQWLKVDINDTNISILVKHRYEMKTAALWLGWIGGSLAIIDKDENLRLCGEDYDKPLDLSHIEPIYASALFKGVWTDGRVSGALRAAGGAALWGVCARGGVLAALGRAGCVRVRARDVPARARALHAARQHARALALLTQPPHKHVATELLLDLAERPHLLDDKAIAVEVVKLCGRYDLSEELWTVIWERWLAYTEGSLEPSASLPEACGEALARGEAPTPKPDASRTLLAKLAELRPALLERTITALPLCALDPHAAATLTRDKGLWRAYGAVVAAIGGPVAALRELTRHVSLQCSDVPCRCAGDALLLASADGVAGRGAGGASLQEGDQPSARHTALHALLHEEDVNGLTISPLYILALHDAHAATQLLRQCWRHPPFAGPLAKHNRLRVARALLPPQPQNGVDESKLLDIVEFLVEEMESGSVPHSDELCAAAARVALCADTARAARLYGAVRRRRGGADVTSEPAGGRHRAVSHALCGDPGGAVRAALLVPHPTDDDRDDLFGYVTACLAADKEQLRPHLTDLMTIRPRQMALILNEHFPDDIDSLLRSAPDDVAAKVARTLLESGSLRGDAAFGYFENLCKNGPEEVVKFLHEYPGTVRPEDALQLVRKYRVLEAEATCLEAAGDVEAAVEVLASRLEASADEAECRRLAREAGAVCARAGEAAPGHVARALWARVLRAAPRLPAAVLLQALRCVPPAALLAHAHVSLHVAASLLRAARTERGVWAAAARVLHRDLYVQAANARRASGAAARGEAHCSSCRRVLSGTARVCVCAHATYTLHEACAPPRACASCPAPAPRPVPPRAPRPDPPQCAHELVLTAPPRPDLEGLV